MFLVFDIGATQSRFGLSVTGKRLDTMAVFPTPLRFSDGVLLLRNIQVQWKLNTKVKAVVGGMPGPLDAKHISMVNAPHLKDWNHKPLKQHLQRIFRAPVHLENDTALVGLGEATHGAGRGYGIVAYVTISTGVNGVRIVEGKLEPSAFGFEIGHQILSIEAPDRVQTWEDFVSGAYLTRRYNRKPENIQDRRIWQEVERYLAYGLNNVIVHWSPNIVVLGGGIMQSKYISLERIRTHLKKVLKIFPILPLIVRASLGDEGGLYGALTYLLSSPAAAGDPVIS